MPNAQLRLLPNGLTNLNRQGHKLPSQTKLLSEHPQGPDWVHPSITVYDTQSIGFGLIATDLIPATSEVILFGGHLMSWRSVCELPEDMRDIPYQVADDIFYGVARREDIGIGERINHSCEPNCGFVSEMKLIALRDIKPGEEVTMDYATCTSAEDYYLLCRCGAKTCRGAVRGTDWRLKEVRRKLGKYFQPYLKEKLEKERALSFRGLLASRLHRLADLISR